MRKSVFKKLSLGMALALVLGTTAHAGVAQAAEATWTLKKTSKTLYLNEDNQSGTKDTYDFNFENLPEGWKNDYSFEWRSKDEKVATVAKGGVVTAQSVGKTTITCYITEKDGGKFVDAVEAEVTVKANAADVQITNKADYDFEEGWVITTGAVVDLNRAMYDENGNKTTKRGVNVTDYTRWYATDEDGNKVAEDVVTIDQATGKFTMNKAGVYGLVCETYQSSKYTEPTATDFVVVIVQDAAPVIDAKQTAVAAFEVVLGTPVAKDAFKADEFKNNLVVTLVSEDGDELVELVKGVEAKYNEDKTAVTSVVVTMWSDLVDGKTYKVNTDDAEDSFVASVGKVKTIDVTVAKNGVIDAAAADVVYVVSERVDLNTLKVVYKDANGIDVTNEVRDGREEWTLEGDTDYFDFDPEAKTVTAYEDGVGKTAKLTIAYYEYDETTGEDVLVAQGVLVLKAQKAPATTINIVKKGIMSATATPGHSDDPKFKSTVAANDSDMYYAVHAKDSWGNKIGNTGHDTGVFTFYVNNDQVASIDPDTGLFTPYKAGTVRVSIYYTDLTVENPTEKYVGYDVVTIKADREAARVDVNTSTATITANVLKGETEASTNVEETASFLVTVKDNLGEAVTKLVPGVDLVMDGDYADYFTIAAYNGDKGGYEVTLKNADVVPVIATGDNKDKATVAVSAVVKLADKEGTAVEKKLTVNLKKPANATISSYKVDVADINVGMKNSTAAATITLYGLNNNGVKVSKVTLENALVGMDIKTFVKTVEGVTPAADLFAADVATGTALIYTITKGTELVKATGEFEATAVTGGAIKVQGEVMNANGNSIGLVDVTDVEDIGLVTVKAKAATYTVTVYEITKKTATDGTVSYTQAKKCSDDFKVTDSVTGINVTQNKIATTENTTLNNELGNKLAWTYDATVKAAVKECFSFKDGDGNDMTAGDTTKMAFEVRANGNSLYVKSVRIFRNVGNDDTGVQYVAITVNVGKTITIGE